MIKSGKSLKRMDTIALLGNELGFEIPISIFKTIRERALRHHYKLLYITGDAINSPFDYNVQSNILYKLISPKIVDGLITISNFLTAYISQQEFREFCLQFHPQPIVSLGIAVEGIPSVVADNRKGMYDAVCHLIEKHHYHHIAFLGGPQEHYDVIERFAAFSRAMKTHGLPIEKSLLFYGNFQRESGIAAVGELLDIRGKKPGQDVQAIVCCNDYMAAGVMLELQLRGIRVPDEIALIGFDNTPFAECLVPSLSSVHMPFDTMAARAIELLITLLEGKPIQEIVRVDTHFIPRHSCGCPDTDDGTAESLLPEHLRELFKTTPHKFLEYMNRQILSSNKPTLMSWKQVLSHLRKKEQLDNQSGKEDSSRIFEQALRVFLEGTAYNTCYTFNYHTMIYYMGIALTSSLDLSELLNTLTTKLPGVEIYRCCLCLYEKPGRTPEALPVWSRLILAFNRSGLIELPSGGLRFATAHLLPEEITRKMGRQSWVILSLYFQWEQIGYILMDSDSTYSEDLYWHLHKQISNALKGTLLMKEHQVYAQKLTRANKIIREFNKKLQNENFRIKTEMEVARNIQTSLLPQNVSNIHHDFEISARMIPADKVGGDYYDILLDRQGALWLGIGDVSGHGLKPGLIMMIAQTVHTAITVNYLASPAEALVMLNRVLIKNVMARMKENKYMTCTLLKYQGEGSFQYAGMHLDLLVYRHMTRSCECIESRGIWLNLIDDIEEVTKNRVFRLETGDVLVLYTDGITEAINKSDQMLDQEGLMELVVRHGEKGIEEMQKAILEDVFAWNDGYFKDDITLVLARRIC